MKNALLGLIALIAIVGVVYFLTKGTAERAEIPTDTTLPRADVDTSQVRDDTTTPPELDAVSPETEERGSESVLGTSTEGRDIMAYHYGTGDTELLFVGGIHGGYSWNTVLVAYELMDYLEENPDVVPDAVAVTVIPVLNPDGLYTVVGTTEPFAPSAVSGDTVLGRFNGNGVDLNRNFDCDWQATGMWQSREVDAGSAPFSEPESRAIETYMDTYSPEAVVVWYSAAGGVFASNCYNGVLPETLTLTNLYAEASGYPAYDEFNFYEITGDMVNWLARENVPAISVLLTNHTDVEWEKNRAGIEALLEYYAE